MCELLTWHTKFKWKSVNLFNYSCLVKQWSHSKCYNTEWPVHWLQVLYVDEKLETFINHWLQTNNPGKNVSFIIDCTPLKLSNFESFNITIGIYNVQCMTYKNNY